MELSYLNVAIKLIMGLLSLVLSWWWLFGCWSMSCILLAWILILIRSSCSILRFLLLRRFKLLWSWWAKTGQQIMIACKREMTLTSIWSRNGKFACCIRRLIIWCSKTRRIYWKFKSCKPNCWYPCLIKWANCVKNWIKKEWKRWRKCRQL